MLVRLWRSMVDTVKEAWEWLGIIGRRHSEIVRHILK